MIDDLFCSQFLPRNIGLMKTHSCDLTDFTVKSRRIKIHKWSMERQSRTIHIFQTFPIISDRFFQIIQIIRNGKFNAFDSCSCLLNDFPHFVIRQKMTDIYHAFTMASLCGFPSFPPDIFLYLNTSFAGLCFCWQRPAFFHFHAVVHTMEMPFILL